METAGWGQTGALACSNPEKCCRAQSGAMREGGLEELPFSRSQGKLISQPTPCAMVLLTLTGILAIWREGHILMTCGGERKGEGQLQGEAQGWARRTQHLPLTSLLSSSSPSLGLRFPIQTQEGMVKHDRKEVLVCTNLGSATRPTI